MKANKLLIIICICGVFFILNTCNKSERYKHDLSSENHPTRIVKAAYELGESKDTSAIKALLKNILDPRMSTNLRFKGMTVCYCKLVALQKIAGIKSHTQPNQFGQDTAAVRFYLKWAVDNAFIKTIDEIDINYY